MLSGQTRRWRSGRGRARVRFLWLYVACFSRHVVSTT